MNISAGGLEKLRKYGFSYPEYERKYERGMIFEYDHQEWIIGGLVSGENNDVPEKVLKNGVWLPGVEHLLMWLRYNSFSYTLLYEDNLFTLIATDSINQQMYEGREQLDLTSALVKVIKKICQSRKRDYLPKMPENHKTMIMNISLGELEKLREFGFAYPYYKNVYGKSMVFWYDHREWMIGGRVNGEKINLPEEVLKNGIWLPSVEQLLSWLRYNSFVYCLSYEDNMFAAVAKDCMNQQIYEVKNQLALTSALAEVILKICQSKKRDYLPKKPEGYKIIDEYDESVLLSNDPES
jgi:hypothetical protein